MDPQVQSYLEKYPPAVVDLFKALRRLLYDSADMDLTEMLWAKLPSYYAGTSFVRLIPFKDHINIEAQAAVKHKEALTGYKITPKGMVQIYVDQPLPSDLLKQIFSQTLV